jgi:ribokinase
MRILNYGSLNMDYVYRVNEIVKPGETIDSTSVDCYPGGKGLNQTLAVARAGSKIYHAGMIGEDGKRLKKLLENDQVDCRFLNVVPGNTGTAFIQVADNGQNCIVLNGGANRMNSEELCDSILEQFGEKDILILQNEINLVNYIIDKAYDKKMYIVFNPSPINQAVLDCNLDKISMFIMNENEGQSITGADLEDDILSQMKMKFPEAEVVLTLGSKGSIYQNKEQKIYQKAFSVKAIDTTAAGDTFTGYFISAMSKGMEISVCLELATKASAIAVSKMGATSSIPHIKEVTETNL